ncbi:hypothetical protein [Hippea maritima]|uniref:Uncharacterized protein n=1 Tax=Hippea maritima (strain ATCC 700847 / DSM 10411 / MH2) TaxID=760142 RepID=F2LV28_HIPMA|nr:hypothetical protein [Hippea maritima]AEA33612.1 hypothetical protein Hipma_0642 [Hippea maritima DSM 10411]
MLKNIIVSLIVSLIVSVGSLYYYHRHFAPKIVAINFNDFLNQQEKLFIVGKINQQQLKDNLKRGLLVVKKQPKNAVVLAGRCVLRGKVINISLKNHQKQGGAK